ncbi:sulfatase [Fulvivirga sp. M361]|uniref:sulfatase n=1 Tax=Fulvivirga sp. M361 TaxID=2594266 RepID=UPI00117BD886|nr:sulfatase [Fulvivirga sp. M361]TRX60018.1 sulfatase [Fulvivirga sp. M361]
MNKTIFMGCVLSICIGIAPSCKPDEEDNSPSRPNVIVIVADDMGWHDPSSYGSEFIETPNLDALAGAGARFTNAYAPASLCSPSRASILTGLHPVEVNITEHIHGPFRPSSSIPLITPDIDQRLGSEYYTLGEMMGREGYNTAYLGKWHLGGGDAKPGTQGFDFTYAANYHGLPNSFYYPFFNHAMEDIKSDAEEGDYLTDKLTDRAINYITEQDTFFMMLCYYSPHVPIEGPEHLVEKYVNKRGGDTGLPNPHYAAMVESIDENIGRLIDQLRKEDKLNNTLIIFTSDNGGLSVEEVPAFAKHTPPTDNGPLAEGKGYLYEGGIRVPMIMHWPDRVSSQVVDDPVVGTDLYATVSDALGKSAKTSHGQSLFSTISGGAKKRSIVWHVPHYSPQHGKPASAIRKGKYKLIYFYEDGRSELYDLENDPSEEKNLAQSQPIVADQLLRELNDWKSRFDAKDPVPNPDYLGG